MTSSGDFSIQNFQSLIENYEAALNDVTGDLDSVQNEQQIIKRALDENTQLSRDLTKALSERAKCEIGHKFQESDLIENLKHQLKLVNSEKEQVIKLWQNATNAVEQLEEEIKIYEQNTEGFIPRSKFIELKSSYEDRVSQLQATIDQTKKQLEETINLKSKELQIKDKEITGTLESHDNTIKIIKNLEDEVLNLQKRLNSVHGDKKKLEKDVKTKHAEVESLKGKVADCKTKVEEAILLVEAALSEKDAALIREVEAKKQSSKLSQTLTDFIDETDGKIKNIKEDYEIKLEQLRQALHASQELVKVKESETENYAKKCSLLEMQLEKANANHTYTDDGATSKILTLEKNLENTFQKLLLSEKQNIQLKAEIESIKEDLDQMSQHYQRDINAREAEKTVLKNEIKKLKVELDTSYLKMNQSTEAINNLNEKISTMEMTFKEQIKETKSTFQQTCIERQEMESVHNQIVQELQEQLSSQIEFNQKWKNETKYITDQLERVINELKLANHKIRRENRILNERLKEANLKMFEYRKFLEMISKDVSKITTITLPEINDCTR